MLRVDANKNMPEDVGYFDFGKAGGPHDLIYTNPYK
jgi:hypothetical protein